MTKKARSFTRYSLTVWIDRVIREEDDLEWQLTSKAQRDLEREVLRSLKVIDGDCDVECMDVETVHEDGPENVADTGHDTWAEWAEYRR
jgi:hypothetical protein